jgi:short-subunit dehydrogenase
MQAQEGAKVALLARTAAEIEAVAEMIATKGGTARAYPLDIPSHENVRRDRVRSRLDVILHGIGTPLRG